MQAIIQAHEIDPAHVIRSETGEDQVVVQMWDDAGSRLTLILALSQAEALSRALDGALAKAGVAA